MEEITCKYIRTIYQSPVYGPSIVIYETDDDLVTVTGKMLPAIKNMTYTFHGMWVNHPKYGRQFQAESYEEKVDQSESAIIEYLSSGLISGIGKTLAARIVSQFGRETLSVMDHDIDKLLLIKGISSGKLIKIRESYLLQRASREIIVRLQKHGISPRLAQEVYARFKGDSMRIIEETPYMLAEVNGITFVTADSIANKTYSYCTDYDRFKACAKYVLRKAEDNSSDIQAIIGTRTSGSTGMEKEDFGRCMLTLLKGDGVNERFVCEKTVQMIRDKSLVAKSIDGQGIIFSSGIYKIERTIAEDMQRLCYSSVEPLLNLDEKINEAEKELGFRLGKAQRDAVKMVFTYGLSVISGPPGSGKTTTFKVIAYINEHYENGSFMFLTPTGRAAARIRELGFDASTIHSALQLSTEKEDDIEEDEVVFGGRMLIGVDEFSMVDARLCCHLLSAIGNGCRVVLCGDADQLPSVGAGAVLRDILSVKSIPQTALDVVYRTSGAGDIYIDCNKIRHGETDLQEGNGFTFIDADEISRTEDILIKEYLKCIEMYGIENVMLLSPYKEHECGVNALNTKIQKILNPDNVNDKIFRFHNGEKYYRIGDPILNLVNDKNLDITNGDIGFVVNITKNAEGEDALVVKFQTGEVYFTKENLNTITLAYACTVHKSQGSEFKAVLMPAHKNFAFLSKRNLVYTGISRGKTEVVVVGQREALNKSILTEDKSRRITSLGSHLKLIFGEFVDASFTA